MMLHKYVQIIIKIQKRRDNQFVTSKKTQFCCYLYGWHQHYSVSEQVENID